MPKKYTIDVRKFVLGMVRKHTKINLISQFTGVSRTTIWRWRKYGFFEKPRKRTPTMLEMRARQIVIETYKTMHHVLVNNIWSQLRHQCCKRTIQRYLLKMSMSVKRAKHRRISKNCTHESMLKYKQEFTALMNSTEDVIFQDESYFSKSVLRCSTKKTN